MKIKTFLIILVLNLHFLSTFIKGQGAWKLQNPLPTNEILNDSYCLPGTSIVWAVGNSGTIIKTLDGNTWAKLNSGVTEDLNGVYFYDSNLGWIVGSNGIIIKTIDGGANWKKQSNVYNNNLNDVLFIYASTGYAIGGTNAAGTGIILKTLNGGDSWNPLVNGYASGFFGVNFVNANTGWVVGSNGTILKTDNGGNSWTTQPSGSTRTLKTIQFVNSNIGWAVGLESSILKTTDGGGTWSPQTIGGNIDWVDISDCYFANEFIGWIVGKAWILKTSDGGSTWTEQNSNSTDNHGGICFTNITTGWVVGSRILSTNNAGSSWNCLSTGIAKTLHSSYFTDTNTGWAVGEEGIILNTINGGLSWSAQTSGLNFELESVHFQDVNNGWALGRTSIIKTNDGGLNWTLQNSGSSDYLFSVFFINTSIGWAVGGRDSPIRGNILKTLDGGATWLVQTYGSIRKLNYIRFFDSNNGVAHAPLSTLLKSSNGGANWTTQTMNAADKVFFVSVNTGWSIYGNNLYKTIDGGTTWMLQKTTTTPLTSLFFYDANDGWASTSEDMCKTSNGGTTWVNEKCDVSSGIQSIFFVNPKTGWAVGNGGEILHYTDYSPTVQTCNLTIGGKSYQSIDLNWLRGNGNHCAIFAKQTTSGTCTPDVNSTYLPNSTFGSGDQIGNTGWYCVYNGSGTSASISGLQANTAYRFQVCEYNFSPDFTHYNSNTTTSNPLSVTTAIAPPQITVNPGDRTLCEPLNTTFSVTTSGSGLSYQWQVDEGSGYINVTNGSVYSGCTTSTLSLAGIPASFNGYIYHCVVTNTSGSASSAGALLTVNPLPVIPTEIAGTQIVCLNNNYTYIVPIIQNATSYEWTYPAGFSGSSTSNTIDLATGSNAVAGIISVKGKNSCGSGPVKNFSVSVKNLPANASQITGLNSVCTGSINIGYSITPLPEADYYLWSLPLGATGTSSINSIMVSFGTNPVSDQITVKGHNICGDGMQSVLPVSVNTVPAAIGTISGISNVCKNQNNVLYSINAIPNATSYAWTLPAGITGSNSTNSISLNIGPDAFSGDLKVSGVNSCGVGAEIVFPVIVNAVPDALGPITGSAVVCRGQTNVQYSVAISDRATSYVWDLPDGSSETTLTNKIVLNFDNSSSSGNLNVTPYNSCGAGNSSSIFIEVSVPPSPTITPSGDTEFCSGENIQLSISPINNVSYQWLRDGGMIGENSNSFTANVAGNYAITVTNSNGCSSTSLNSISVIVNSVPQISTVSLSGPTTFCSGGSVILNTPLTSGYSYNWRNETGLITGANTNSYLANTSGSYQLDISNSSGCVVKTLPVNVLVKPMPIKPVIDPGNYQPGKCMGENPIRLNVSQAVTGYSYQWYKNGIPVNSATSSTYEAFLSQGDYSLEAGLSGCKIQSDLLNVYFENAPEKPLIYAEGSNIWYLACSNDSASQYKWYFNGSLIQGADKYIYVANKNLGRYNVSIANAKGCFTISDAITIPVGTTGVKDIDPFSGLKIYPNPTPGLFTIEMDNQLFGDLVINILTQEGKNILKIKFEKTTIHFSSQIDLSGQSKGMYLINLLIDKYLANRKVIVE